MNDFITILLIIAITLVVVFVIMVLTVKINDIIEEAAEYHRKMNE